MTLVFDRREALAGQDVTHALIVGVSEYAFLPGKAEPPMPHFFGLKRLASPALSAAMLCAWLVEHADALARPLASCRLLLSPSPFEVPLIPPLPAAAGVTAAAAGPANWLPFVSDALALRQDAGVRRGDTTFVFYSGHGLEKAGADLITLADFGDPASGGLFAHTTTVASLIAGMAPSDDYPDMARTQFYFIDACRQSLEGVDPLAPTGVALYAKSKDDTRATPTFQAAYPGSIAMTLDGQPTDFCRALLDGLARGAEGPDLTDPQERWPVTTYTLHKAISNHFAALGSGQFAPLGFTLKDEVLLWLPEPPQVDVAIMVMPEEAIDHTHVTLSGPTPIALEAVRANHPYRLQLKGGPYTLEARPDPAAFRTYRRSTMVNQRLPLWPVRLESAS